MMSEIATADAVLRGDVNYAFVCADAVEGMRMLPDRCIHTIITSPPYYGLRQYATSSWTGGDPECDHKKSYRPINDERSTLQSVHANTNHQQEGYRDRCPRCGAVCTDRQIGLEDSPDQYVSRLVEVFREARRVLRDDGVLCLNLGDSYASEAGSKTPQTIWQVDGASNTGIKHGPLSDMKVKDLMEIPSLVVAALRVDGWYLRSRIPWLKQNCLPESVTDRPTSACEYFFLLAKKSRYYWDQQSVQVTAITIGRRQPQSQDKTIRPSDTPWHDNRYAPGASGYGVHPNGRNYRNTDAFMASLNLRIEETRAYLMHLESIRNDEGLLTNEDKEPLALMVNTRPTNVAHYAAFPVELVTPLIKTACPEKCCRICGLAWDRLVNRTKHPTRDVEKERAIAAARTGRGDGYVPSPGNKIDYVETIGWRPRCACVTGDPIGGIVLDPFSGVGTTVLAARLIGRRGIGIDLSQKYTDLAEQRIMEAKIADDGPMMSAITSAEKQGHFHFG